MPRHGSRRAQGADLRERRGPPTQCLLGLPLRDGRSCETRRHVDDVRILRGAAVRVPQLLVSTTQVFSVEHGNGSIAEQLRTAGPSLGRRVIQAGHKVIIQMHEHLTSAHRPCGQQESQRALGMFLSSRSASSLGAENYRRRKGCAVASWGPRTVERRLAGPGHGGRRRCKVRLARLKHRLTIARATLSIGPESPSSTPLKPEVRFKREHRLRPTPPTLVRTPEREIPSSSRCSGRPCARFGAYTACDRVTG